MSAVIVCKFYKFGFCKFGDRCRYHHENTVCADDDCTIHHCSYRHPRACRFYQEYGRCKFGIYCQFSHNKLIDQEKTQFNFETIINKLSAKVDEKLKNLQDEITKIGNIAIQLEKNMEKFKPVLAPHIDPVPLNQASMSSTERPISTPARKDVARSFLSVSLQPFQTQPGSSCCDHLCRPDPNEDPSYAKCCRHRCRKPWT